jgi:hypothetical protein
MALVSIDLIKQELEKRIDDLVPQLFPNAVLDGHEWRLGDVHGSPGRSLGIHRHGSKTGWWKDFAGGSGGDVLDLVAAGACQGDVVEAIKWSRQWLNLGSISEDDRRQRERNAADSRIKRDQGREEGLQRLRKAALARFLEAVPLPGTPAERYLAGRALPIRELGKAPGALRFHPGLKCPETGILRPCFIGKIDGPDGQMLSIHRTFLHVHASGRVTKADQDPVQPMKDCKRAYCSFEGGWIPIWRGQSGKPMKDALAGEWVTVSEGKEDGVTIALEMPHMRVIAGVSLSNIGNLKLPRHLGGIYLHRHNDTNPIAIADFERTRAKLEQRGFATREVAAPLPFKDFNEWRQARFASQITQAAVS